MIEGLLGLVVLGMFLWLIHAFILGMEETRDRYEKKEKARQWMRTLEKGQPVSKWIPPQQFLSLFNMKRLEVDGKIVIEYQLQGHVAWKFTVADGVIGSITTVPN